MNLDQAWNDLVASPIFAVALTLVAYYAARLLWQRVGNNPIVNPVLVAIVIVGTTLWLVDVDYETYSEGGRIISMFLGPATVALAWPMHRELTLVKRAAVPILAAVTLGSGMAVATVLLLTEWLGGSEELALSLAPKSATTPVAIALSTSIGGVPALTAVFTILTGVVGAVIGPKVLTLLRVEDARVRGLAIGVSSHGIGTAQMLHEGRTAGAFAGLAMALTALATSIWIPILVPWLT